MSKLALILLDQTANSGGGWEGMIMIVAMIVIFYFFMIRPQSKKQKELKKAREAMKKGDKVITAGGIHGRIKELNDNIVMMEIAPGVVIKIDKTSVFTDLSAASKPEAGKENKGKQDSKAAGADLDEAAGKVAKKEA